MLDATRAATAAAGPDPAEGLHAVAALRRFAGRLEATQVAVAS